MARGDSKRGDRSNRSEKYEERGFTETGQGLSVGHDKAGKADTIITEDKEARDDLRSELDAIDAEEEAAS